MPTTATEHPTLELPRATPPPPDLPPVVYGTGDGGRGLRWALGIALVIALATVAWQATAVSDARDDVATLQEQLTALEQDVEELRTENEELRAENEELRAAADGNGPLGALLGPLLRGEIPSEDELLDSLLPHLDEELGTALGGLLGPGLDDLAEQLERDLGDLFGGG